MKYIMIAFLAMLLSQTSWAATVVLYTAPQWCHACKIFDKEVWEHTDFTGHDVTVKNFDDPGVEAEFTKLGLKYLPTVVIYKGDKVIKLVNPSKKQLEKELE